MENAPGVLQSPKCTVILSTVLFLEKLRKMRRTGFGRIRIVELHYRQRREPALLDLKFVLVTRPRVGVYKRHLCITSFRLISA